MPPSDRPRTEAALAALVAFRERGGAADDPAQARAVALLADHAPSLLHLVRTDPSCVADALARPIEHDSDRATLAAELSAALGAWTEADGPELRRELRRYRHRAIIRIALREILRAADVDQTSREMADLAAVVLDAALSAARATESARHGACQVPLVALGMGKLGGGELNLGSDVDLVFFYETDEAAVGDGSGVSVHELHSRVTRRACAALSEVTEDGFCFRVDLRLRPEGSRGPLVNSLASAERYYESWGRTWERAAMLRAAPIAGDLAFGHELLAALQPFIYRRAVDPSLAVEMNGMLLRSRRELDVDEERDVKLGRGGIREAEFFVQTLQLVWGGLHPELRVAGTLEALGRLQACGLVSDREAETLADAWALLRRIEHRIHVWCGYQTHALPSDPEELERFAESLGFEDARSLEARLGEARAEVAALLDGLMPGAVGEDDRRFDAVGDLVAKGAPVAAIGDALGEVIPVQDNFVAASHAARLGRRANAPLGPVTWERLPTLGRALLAEVSEAADPETALRFLADFSERLGGRWPYERMLLEQPRLTRRLVGLFGASGTLSSALVGHPEDIDRLMRSDAPSGAEIAEAHSELSASLHEKLDPEDLVRELRRLKRGFTLRVGLAYVAQEIDLWEAAGRLSELAEGQVRVSLAAAERWASGRWGEPSSRMVVCAMGKLGGRELGFGADLDLVFLYGEDGSTRPSLSGRTTSHAELFARVAQRTMMLLRQRDAQGPGYETDTRLRPSGSKGTLVVSLGAFDRYHERGAASWERQALIRARPIAGDEEVGRGAMERISRLTYESGAPPAEELAGLRARVQSELAGESRHRYHPKLGFGGLLDVELLAQWLQMRHGVDPRVRTPSTRRALAALHEIGALAPVELDSLRDAYGFFRRVEQSLKLFEEHREPLLEPRGRTGMHVARSLGLRERDGLDRIEVLEQTYRHHAAAARDILEARVGREVGAGPPWSRA